MPDLIRKLRSKTAPQVKIDCEWTLHILGREVFFFYLCQTLHLLGKEQFLLLGPYTNYIRKESVLAIRVSDYIYYRCKYFFSGHYIY